ncbi:hypothetical protein ABL78_7391 [Leptomonas seymouri]|uniref:Uncharacterized protein n=1 Tax=Leptomonas seymouri TaxID=5684 RepID=A0A0N1IH80_LEPSE|nr:hypothetical protein ABL78_7391 [Leptomonas seymouri]|eukprot:KPI83568.1 hypothetical protein ABL78_7391 [Leptomonas seymouri]
MTQWTAAATRHVSSVSRACATPHSHDFISVQHALQAAKCSIKGGASSGAAGLTFTLPPMCIWGSSLHSHPYSNDCGQGHTGRYSGLSASCRYASIWSPIEAYLAELNNSTLQHAHLVSPATSTAQQPVFVSLRLFPDLSVAQLPTTFLQMPRSAQGGAAVAGASRSQFLRRHRRPAAPHEQPLEAILAMEEPWGSGADPQQTFSHALNGLREIGQRLLPQVPLILQLPTRLLVSQQFLEDLVTLLVQSGWRSVSFELPSTHQLYSPFQAHSSDSNGNGVSSSSRCSWSRAGRKTEGNAQVLSSQEDDGAIDAAWCRLPLLCTPWPALCRHAALGPSLRQLRRRDVVPFHILFSWALTEAKLFDSLEQSMVVDVTAPMPGAELAQATRQSPSSVGVPAEEARRAFHNQKPVPAPSSNRGGEEEEGDRNSRISDLTAQQHSVYMSENPTTSRGAGVVLSGDVMDAVRQHQSQESSVTRRRSCAISSSSAADLSHTDAAWRRAKTASPTNPTSKIQPAPPQSSVTEPEDAAAWILDTPPDHLRALIENSIAKSDAPDSPAALAPRQLLLQKVGQFMQHTLQHDAVESTRPVSDEPCTTTLGRSTDEDALAKEAAELEELMRQADNGAAASASVEHMMVEVQRYMREQAQRDRATVASRVYHSSGSQGTVQQQVSDEDAQTVPFPSAHNVWCQCGGYWACMRALLSDLTRATLVWTLPTYNAAAIQAWVEAYTAAMPAEGKVKNATAPAAVPLPPVVPVWMPLQPAMHTEVERLLREGHHFPQPPLSTSSAQEECCTWLPKKLNAELQAALAQLPADVKAHQRRRLLHGYRLLRNEGAQGARRCGCEIDPVAASTTKAADPSNVANAESSLEDGAGESAHRSTEENATSGEVRVRLRGGVQPFYVLPPSQVAKMEEAEEQRTATAAAISSAESTAGEAGVAPLTSAREVDDAFQTKVATYYRDTGVAQQQQQPSSLYVPTPGLGAPSLHRSWRAIP